MCDITSIAVFSSESIESFPGILLLLLLLLTSFMQGIYYYIPETNHVPREYSFAAIL